MSHRARPLALTLLVALCLMSAGTAAAWAVSDFDTPGDAAYCGLDHHKANHLTCWTPNDGFTVSMRRKGTAGKRYEPSLKGTHDIVGQRLDFGEAWRANGFKCKSRRSGLTCKNRRGHGWWLGRYVGYRLF